MPILDLEDFKGSLPQVNDYAGAEYDDLLIDIIEEVEDMIALYLGFSFDEEYEVGTTRIVYGSGLPWLELPPHEAGSITSLVYEGSTTEITGWTEDATGRLYWAGYPLYSRWPHMARYAVTASWGYGEWPLSIKRVAKELVANIWTESKTGHFSDVQGVQGAGGDIAVGYAGALTKRQKLILDKVIDQYQGVTV